MAGVFQRSFLQIVEKCFQHLKAVSCIVWLVEIKAYVFHLDNISHTSNFDIEALEIGNRLFLDLLCELSLESRFAGLASMLTLPLVLTC